MLCLLLNIKKETCPYCNHELETESLYRTLNGLHFWSKLSNGQIIDGIHIITICIFCKKNLTTNPSFQADKQA